MKAIVVYPENPMLEQSVENLKCQIEGMLMEAGYEPEELSVFVCNASIFQKGDLK